MPKITKELKSCKILEKIYHEPFKKTRPSFLINPETGRRLELDCFNEDLRIALEYQGPQHYHWPNYTLQSKEEFLSQLRRDIYKEELCKRNGIKLIKVPYTVPEESLEEYIKISLQK